MISDIQNLLDKYIFWLKDRTVLREVKDWVEITTPYLDRHNDYLQIYAKKHNGGFSPMIVILLTILSRQAASSKARSVSSY